MSGHGGRLDVASGLQSMGAKLTGSKADKENQIHTASLVKGAGKRGFCLFFCVFFK